MVKVERIATVKATGKRYVVQQLDLRQDVCHCWSELVKFEFKNGKLIKAQFENPIAFPLKDVAIKDAVLTVDVLDELFEQTKTKYAAEIEAGKLKVHASRRRVRM